MATAKRRGLWLWVVLCSFVTASSSWATTDLDRRYSLETVGALRAWDNVDGLFVDYVAEAYRDYFSRQSRFVLQDLSKDDPILTASKIPYNKLIEDHDILVEVARSTRSQTLIRTKVSKEGKEYTFEMDWLHAPDMDTLAQESFTLEEPSDGHGFASDELKTKIEQGVDKMIRQVPFLGAVTGRDSNSVTLNIGSSSGIEKGDIVQVATLDEVRKHPLLKQIVEWRFANTGKIEIDQVDERIAFGHVIEEEPNRQIMRQQKVTEIRHAPAVKAPANTGTKSEQQTATPESDEPPRIGWISGGLNLGNFSRSYSSLDNTIGKSGSGLAYGFNADGQLWITPEWFAELGVNFDYYSYSQTDTTQTSSPSTSLGSGNLVGYHLAAGYSYLVNGDLLGPKGWVKVGYHGNSYNLPDSSTNAITPISFKSLYLGLGGDLPIRSGFGAFLDFNIGLFNSVTESPTISGNANSTSDVSFSLGAYYHYTQRVSFKAAIDFVSDSASFDSNRSVSQKVITFAPAIQYYF